MQLADLSPIAQVGIGVNLMFCLIQMVERFSQAKVAVRVEARAAELERRVSEAPKPQAEPAIAGLRRIVAAHGRLSTIYGTSGIALALATSMGLSFVVGYCALRGSESVDDIWAVALFLVMWFPALAATLGQVGLYREVVRQLDRQARAVTEASASRYAATGQGESGVKASTV